MKYLTIKDTRAILIRYILIIFVLWLILVLSKSNETISIEPFLSIYSVDMVILRPHIVGIVTLLLSNFIIAHALSYRLSRWINNGRRGWGAALRALFISWTVVTFIVLFIVSQFKVTQYVIFTSLCPLILSPLLNWELRRASRLNS